MMKQRLTVPVAAALSLLLAACGGDESGGTPPDDKMQGADKADESPSPSPSTEAAGRPEIELPKDITYEFGWSKTEDPDTDAVLRDGEQLIKAIDLAIAEQDPAHEALLLYTEGEAAAEAERFVQGYVEDEDRTTGRYRSITSRCKSQKTARRSCCGGEGSRTVSAVSVRGGHRGCNAVSGTSG